MTFEGPSVMTKIVNLNQFRKNRLRAEKKSAAENNRIKSGRTKEERKAAQAAQLALDHRLDGKKFDDPKDPEKT